MKILVTRPEPDASRQAARLQASGHEAVIEPLMEVADSTGAAPALEGVQALAFTSANGVRAFAGLSDNRSLVAFAVGEATGAAASDAGFRSVHIAGGDVDHLAGLIGTVLDPDDGTVLHIAGKVVAGDLAGTLAAFGFQVERAVLYGTKPREAFSKETAAALADGSLDGVTLYSPRTARTFKALIEVHGLAEACLGLTCFALSENVAAALAGLSFAGLEVAIEPNEDALMELLEED